MFMLAENAQADVRLIVPPNQTISIAYAPGLNFNQTIPITVHLRPGKDCDISGLEDFSLEWNGNYFNATTYTTGSNGSRRITINFNVMIDDTTQNIMRRKWSLRANWTQLPLTEIFTVRAKGWVNCLNMSSHFNKKIEFKIYINPRGRGTPLPGVPGGAAGFVLNPQGSLIWQNCPGGPKTVASNITRFRAVNTSSGPVVIYQTGTKIRFKMLDFLTCGETAAGDIGGGTLRNVDFSPGSYGATAVVTAQEGSQTVYYVFKIDRWGKYGITRQVGSALKTNLPHWVVRWRSMIYVFEFDQAKGRLTCRCPYSGWETEVDSGIDGLIVPTATGSGPVVVYKSGRGTNQNIRVVMLGWKKGGKASNFSIGSGTLLQVNYTSRGSYGTGGTAVIRSSSSSKTVNFCATIHGKFGCNGIISTTPWPSGTPLPPDPPPGFPGGGGEAPSDDTDGDGFSDAYEQAAGTDPNDPNSHPNIDLSIVLLIDKSGSMSSNNKMEQAKSAAINALSKINKSTEVGVMAYSGGCGDKFPVIADFFPDIAYLSQKIKTIQPGGGTPMSPALFQAREFLWKRSHGKQGLIILLCDGQNNCPPNEADAARQIFKREIPAKISQLPKALDSPKKRTSRFNLARFFTSLIPAAEAATQDTKQQKEGGPDSVPPGQTPPEIIPEDLEPPDPSKGGVNYPPPGVEPPQNLSPVLFTPPYGIIGTNTTVAPAQPEKLNQQLAIQISTIGFGLQNDPQAQKAMAQVAKEGGGQTYDAQNQQQLTSAFSQAITQQPAVGGGGAPIIAPPPLFNWPVILLISLGMASIIIAISIVVISSRRRGVSLQVYTKLDVFYSDGGRKSVHIQGLKTSIGRSKSNSLVINDSEISSNHAEIIVSRDGFLLKDLGSANGTYVNGEKISDCYLYLGDEITLGTTKLVFGS